MLPSRTQKPRKVIAVRSRENRQNDPAITSHNNGDSIPIIYSPALSPQSVTPYAVSARTEQSITPRVSDMVQLALARVQDIEGSISLVGSPLQAAFNRLLTILQAIGRHAQTELTVNRLVRQLHRLWRLLCSTPCTHAGSEQCRRDDLMSLLQDTSDEVTKLDNEGLGYQSVTEALAKFSTELEKYLTEYTFATKIHTHNDVLEIDGQLQHFRGSAAMDLPGTVTRHCIILIDATGHEHRIPMEFCMSREQLKKMLDVLFAPNTEIASIQRRFLEQGQYDLCIDQGTQITELRSKTDGWSIIEAGTKVVMRIIMTKNVYTYTAITCDGCGYSNLSLKSAGVRGRSCWTIYCRECKRQYQVSNPSWKGNIGDVTEESTNTSMMHEVIRNIHVQEVFRREFDEREEFFFERRFEREFERELFEFVRHLIVQARQTMLVEPLPCPTLSSSSCSLDDADRATAMSHSQQRWEFLEQQRWFAVRHLIVRIH